MSLEGKLKDVKVASWNKPVRGIILDGVKIEFGILEDLSDQDAFSTEMGATPVLLPSDVEKILLKYELINKRTRGSCYGSEKLHELLEELYKQL